MTVHASVIPVGLSVTSGSVGTDSALTAMAESATKKSPDSTTGATGSRLFG